MRSGTSELQVVTAAKKLCKYVFIVTNKSPKCFRFTLVSRMQNLCLDVIEEIYKANEIFVKEDNENLLKERLRLQYSALTKIKLISYLTLLSLEQNCILQKQFEQITKLSTDCQFLLAAWIKHSKNCISKIKSKNKR